MSRKKNFTKAEISKRYREKNKDKLKSTANIWRKKNPDKAKEWSRKNNQEIKQQCFDMFGGKCCKCDFSDIRALQIDHINGAEEQHSDPMRGGKLLYLAIIGGDRPIGDFQLLCANCNMIKMRELGEYGQYKKNKKPATEVIA